MLHVKPDPGQKSLVKLVIYLLICSLFQTLDHLKRATCQVVVRWFLCCQIHFVFKVWILIVTLNHLKV